MVHTKSNTWQGMTGTCGSRKTPPSGDNPALVFLQEVETVCDNGHILCISSSPAEYTQGLHKESPRDKKITHSRHVTEIL